MLINIYAYIRHTKNETSYNQYLRKIQDILHYGTTDLPCNIIFRIFPLLIYRSLQRSTTTKPFLIARHIKRYRFQKSNRL